MVGYFMSEKGEEGKPKVKDLSLVQTESNEVETADVNAQLSESQQYKEVVSSPLQGQTWVSMSNGAMLTIEGNRYTIDFPSVEDRQPMMGAITFSKGGFTVINHQSDDPCGNQSGAYTFHFDGEDVVIKTKSDPCRTRSIQLQASWFSL